jgi:hypothetical protein
MSLRCLLLLGVASSQGATQAQDKGKPSEAFMIALAEASRPILQQQITALEALEKRAAVAKDYEVAIGARDQRRALLAELDQQDKLKLLTSARSQAASSVQKISLKLSDAVLDQVTLDGEGLTGWSAPGASATWKLPSLPPGGYEVLLRYRSGPQEGGKLRIAESFYTLTTGITTTLKDSMNVNVGTLRIQDGSGTLRLSALTVLGGNLMRLEAIELIPGTQP